MSTPLWNAFVRSDADAVLALLDDCRARGAMPMASDRQNLFAALSEPSMDAPQAVFACDVLRKLGEGGLPSPWREAIGRALLQASARPPRRSGLDRWERLELRVPMSNNANRGFVMMMHASLRPGQWLKLFEHAQYELHVPTALACASTDFPQRSRILRNMVDDGLGIDRPRAGLAGVSCTMLQAAAENDCADMAALLLELGADPFARLARGDAPPQDAFALAPEGGAVRGVLAAWRAQRAMAAVLRPATKPGRRRP